jgi:ATP-binding cassette subfamily C protein CydD
MSSTLAHHLRAARSTLLLTVALGVLQTLAVIAQFALLSGIVSHVFLDGSSLDGVWPLLLWLLGASALRAALVGAREVSAQWAAVRVKSALRARLVEQLLQAGTAEDGGAGTGEVIITAVEGIDRLDAYVGRYLPHLAMSVVVPLIIAGVLVPIDLTSAGLLLLTAPVIPLLMVVVGSYAEQHVRRQWTALTRLGGYFLDVVQGLPTLLLFDRANAESERVERVSERFRERTMKVFKTAFLSGMALEFLTLGAIGVVAVALGIRLLDGNISFARAFFVLLLAPEFYRPLRELGIQRHAGMEGKAAMAQIAELLEQPAPVASAPIHCDTATPSPCPRPPLTVVLRDVTYAYPASAHPALDGVTSVLRPGTRTALVGRSGAGKSTLVDLLLGFRAPQGGTIAVNGVPLDTLSPEAWRERVALVPQRPYLFAGTLRENLQIARAGVSDAALLSSCELAGLSDVIAQLPGGLDARLGERGAGLSAGQAQRLAIARAFVKDAPLLILDEPTSSLDPESEARIHDALRVLTSGRTVLIVAHRLNTVMEAEQIVVLDRGRVAESGAHADLLVRGGAYAELVAAGARSCGGMEVPA